MELFFKGLKQLCKIKTLSEPVPMRFEPKCGRR